VQLGDHALLGASWGQKTKEYLYGAEGNLNEKEEIQR
jgi:hypothetical protein